MVWAMLYQMHNPGAPIELNLGGLRLIAFSISAIASYVMVPEFDAVFDLGHCPLEAVRLRNVLLSHCHLDHCAGVPLHLSLRRMYGSRPSRVYVPDESAPLLRKLLHSFDELEQDEQISYETQVRGIQPSETIHLSGKYSVKTFAVQHRLPSLGYTVIEHRKKLRPEYASLPGPAIAEAKQKGEDIHSITEVNHFTYVGDSTIETLRSHPEVGQSRVLFLEATHLPGTKREVSATWGHTHLEELAELAHEQPAIFASEYLVLKHFSTRYAAHEIRNLVSFLPEWLRSKITILIPPAH
jgi:ribonuclease Z